MEVVVVECFCSRLRIVHDGKIKTLSVGIETYAEGSHTGRKEV